MFNISIFKIVLLLCILLVDSVPAASGNTDDLLVYKAREKRDENAMSATESIIVHDLTTDTRQTIVTYTNTIESGTGYADFLLEVSPDGRFVFSDGGITYVWDKGELIELIGGYNYQWSADGRLAFIAYDQNESDIYIWHDGELTPLGLAELDLDTGDYMRFDWSSDGRFLLIFENLPAIYVWDEGRISSTISSPDAEQKQIISASWSLDGRIAFIAGSNPDWDIFVWADDTVTQLGAGFPPDPVWNLDGQLAYGTGASIYVWEGGSGDVVSEGVNPQWSSDGRLAFTSRNSDTLYVWDGSTITEAASVSAFYTPAWSADGRLVLSDGDLHIWNDGTLTRITDTPDLEEIDPNWLPS